MTCYGRSDIDIIGSQKCLHVLVVRKILAPAMDAVRYIAGLHAFLQMLFSCKFPACKQIGGFEAYSAVPAENAEEDIFVALCKPVYPAPAESVYQLPAMFNMP